MHGMRSRNQKLPYDIINRIGGKHVNTMPVIFAPCSSLFSDPCLARQQSMLWTLQLVVSNHTICLDMCILKISATDTRQQL